MVSFCFGGGVGMGDATLEVCPEGWGGGAFCLGLSYGLRCLGSASESGLAWNVRTTVRTSGSIASRTTQRR